MIKKRNVVFNFFLIICLLFIFLSYSSVFAAGTIIYVDKSQKTGPWNGTSWVTAYTQISGPAMNDLASFGSNVTILIAAGTYKEKIDIRSSHSGKPGFTNVIKGYTNGVVIDGENTRFCIEFGADGQPVEYVTIENLRVTRGNDQDIRVMWCHTNTFRRLIIDRTYANPNGWGIFISGNSYYNTVINCTIISNTGGVARGICLAGDAYGTRIRNNIIAFNKEGINGPSVTPPTVLTYNDVVSNNTSGNYNGGVSPGVGTITNDPLFVSRDPNSSDFVKLSSSSPCIDVGDPSDSDSYMRNGRVDMGAKEYSAGPFYVDDDSGNDGNDGSFSAPFATIQHAADVMSAGPPSCTVSTTYIFPGNYAQYVDINSNKNSGYMVFTALSNTKPHFTGGLWAFTFVSNTSRVVFKNLYISNYSAVGIYLNNSRSNVCISNTIVHVSGGGWAGGIGIFNNSDNNRVIGNLMHDNERSIKLSGSLTRFNAISNNTIYNDTSDAGIYLRGSCRSNYIYDNTVRGCTAWAGGIYLESAHQNIFKGNTIWSNQLGIYFDNNSKGNSIISNVIFSNTQCAIYLKNATNTLVQGNTAGKEHGWAGAIYLDTPAYSNIIRENIITNSTYGVFVKGHKDDVIKNKFLNIEDTSVYFSGAVESVVVSNAFLNNNRGFFIENSTNILLKRNAIHKSQNEGMYIASGTNIDIINNTLVSNNLNNWGVQLDVDGGTVDVIKNNIVAFRSINGYGIYNNSSILSLTYNDVFSNGGDWGANYYNCSPGVGSISNNPLFLSTDIYSSNFLALSSGSPCIDAGDPADTVPAGGGSRIDMGWKEYFKGVILNIIKSVSNIMAPLGTEPIPGAKIIYKLYYTNLGIGENQIIYDQLPSNVTFLTSYFASGVTGWTLQYSTNFSPTNKFNSSDYSTSIPSDKTTIKWIRWKKPTLSNNETGILYYEVMIK